MKPLGVTEVNTYIKKIFAGDMLLSNIDVEGEVSNYRPHHSGHLYFSLKDEMGRIKCVMFKSYAERCGVQIVEGQNIIVKGYISVYEKNGEYQLYVRDIIDRGVGQLYRQFEKLKLKLELEGLFAEESKKPIPTIPKKIGLVTSSTGAAVRDIVTITKRRFPPCNILIFPSLVQGENAVSSIIEGLIYLDKREDIDLIILARGGGSIDELFVFNDEQIARTIFQLTTPIISAIGHETDFTISDFVADLRAPTPSAAAELAVPNMMSLKKILDGKYRNIIGEYRRLIKENSSELEMLYKSIQYNSPEYDVRNKAQELDLIFKELHRSMEDILYEKYNQLSNLEKNLQLLNPIISLEKGNGILLNDKGLLISSAMDVKIEDEIKILLRDGWIDVVVKDINIKEEDERHGTQ